MRARAVLLSWFYRYVNYKHYIARLDGKLSNLDTHVHASQYPIVGLFDERSLISWLNGRVFPTEWRYEDAEVARQVYRACVKRTLSHGTTTAAYYTTIHVPATKALADICLELRQRAFIGRMCMDNNNFCPPYLCDKSSQELINKTTEVIEYINSKDPDHEIISPALAPRFALACTPSAMSELSGMYKAQHLLVPTHLAENRAEVKLVAETFPEAGSYTKVYDNYGLLTPRTVLGHSVHITEGEASLIKKRQSKVAHCPCSNSALASGMAQVRWMWDRGIDVGLGTDMSGGYSPSMLEAARQAVLVSRQLAAQLSDEAERQKVNLSVPQVLYLATRGGAKVVGLDEKIGGFERDKDWDAQLIGLNVVASSGKTEHENAVEQGDTGNVDLFPWDMSKWDDMIAKWVYNGDDRNAKKVWVKGQLVHSRL